MTEREWPHCLAEIPIEERPELDEFQLAKIQRQSAAAQVASGERFSIRTDIRTANYGPWPMRAPVGILLHHTAGHEGSDIPTLTRPGTGVSSNYYITRQGAIFEFAPYPRRAWHAGESSWAGVSDWNTHSIGIEIENFGVNPKMGFPNGQDWPREQIDALVWLCRRLVNQFPAMKAKQDLLARHLDVGTPRGRKVDPNATNPHPFPYQEVRRRVFAAKDSTDPDAPKPEPAPVKPPPDPVVPVPWLPDAERTAFGTYDIMDLDSGKIHVLTLDGKERASIVPKGTPALVPTPGKAPEKEPEPEPEPEKPPKPDDPKAAIINRYFGTNYGQTIIDEAKKANLHITSACALVEQESNGRNIFGADWGTRGADRVPFAHLPVTRERVQKLVSHVRGGGVSNGIGLTQITWRDFIFDAENRGGAHLPKNQCAVGFELLASYYGKYPYLEAIGAYNAGESNRRSVISTYSAQFAAKHRGWIERLGSGANDTRAMAKCALEVEPAKEEEEMEPTPEPGRGYPWEPKPSLKPKPKIVAASAAGAVVVILVWMLSRFAGVDAPPDVAAAATLLVAALIGYITSES